MINNYLQFYNSLSGTQITGIVILCMIAMGIVTYIGTKSLVTSIINFNIVNSFNLTIILMPWMDLKPFYPLWLTIFIYVASAGIIILATHSSNIKRAKSV